MNPWYSQDRHITMTSFFPTQKRIWKIIEMKNKKKTQNITMKKKKVVKLSPFGKITSIRFLNHI